MKHALLFVISASMLLMAAAPAPAAPLCRAVLSTPGNSHFTSEDASQLNMLLGTYDYAARDRMMNQFQASGQMQQRPLLWAKMFSKTKKGLGNDDGILAYQNYLKTEEFKKLGQTNTQIFINNLIEAGISAGIKDVSSIKDLFHFFKGQGSDYQENLQYLKDHAVNIAVAVVKKDQGPSQKLARENMLYKMIDAELSGSAVLDYMLLEGGVGYRVIAYSNQNIESGTKDAFGFKVKEVDVVKKSQLPLDKAYSLIVDGKKTSLGIQDGQFSKIQMETLERGLAGGTIYVDVHVLGKQYFQHGDPDRHPFVTAKLLSSEKYDLSNEKIAKNLWNLDVKALAKDPNWQKAGAENLSQLLSRIIGDYAQNKVSGVQGNIPSLMKLIQRLKPLFAEGEMINTITNELQAKLKSSKQPIPGANKNLPDYNVFKMIKESVREGLGEESSLVQDIYVHKDSKISEDPHVHIYAFSNHSVDGKPVNVFGYSYVELEQALIEKPIDKIYTWTVDKKKASAHIKYHLVDLNLTIDHVAPKYQQMLADHKLGGLVLISGNLSDLSMDLADEYTNYFRDHGFEVGEYPAMSAKEAYEFILEHVRSGEIDYSIREGHKEFSPEAMITYGNNPIHILEATKKKKKNNFEEIVYIVYPDTTKAMSSKPSQTLGLSELGDALRSRDKSGQQFLYFDSACMNHCYTGNRYELAAAPGFTPVSSESFLNTFINEAGGASYEFVDGVREQRNYKDMGKRMKGESVVLPNDRNYIDSETLKQIEPMSLMVSRNFSPEVKIKKKAKAGL